MLPKRFLLHLGFIVTLLIFLTGQPMLSAVPMAAIPLSSSYGQNFDTLAPSGAGNTWTNDNTISGWYATRTTYNANSGNSTTGALYSYGADTDSERALGSLASGTTGMIHYGARFVNDTGDTVTSLTVSYIGEQWRNGGNTTQHQLDFSYQIGITVTSLTGGTWTDENSLDFLGPIATATAGVLDGNEAANRVTIIHTFAVNIPAGHEIMLRWTDIDNMGNDHGLAIDELTVTASNGGDLPPTVIATNPVNGATGVTVDADITITFSEDVNVTGTWFDITCTDSGNHTAVVTGTSPTTVYLVDPDVDFANGETCTITIYATQVEDIDDTPDNMAADYSFNFVTAAAPTGNALRISQVYGGGGNVGSIYTHDYIELFNAGTTTISLAGWSVQYGPVGNTTWSGRTNLSGDIAPGQYYLVQQASNGGGTTPLPTPDAIGTINMAVGAGKVALVSSTVTLPDGCVHADIVDLVGYGTAICYEGGAAAPGLSAANAGFRQQNGCQDTNQNGDDFFAAAAAPRNTSSPLYFCLTDTPPSVVSSTPAHNANSVALDANITITFSEDVTLDPGWYTLICTSSGVNTAIVTGGPASYILDPTADFVYSEACMMTIAAAAVHDVDDDDPPDTMELDYSFTFTTIGGGFGACEDGNALPIHIIQGNGLSSPIAGAVGVTIEGIVVGDFQGSALLNGFFVQEEDGDVDGNPLSSEGLFVYAPSAIDVNLGDLVRVQGEITEFFNLTEMTNVTNLTICNNGLSVTPAMVALPFPDSSYLEQFEGMLVTLPQTLFVTEHFNLGRGGYLVVSSGDRLYQPTHLALPGAPANAVAAANALNRLILDDGALQQNPDPIVYPPPGLTALNSVRIGDTVSSITGVLTYSYDGWGTSANNYRLHPTTMPLFAAANPRTLAPADLNGIVKVASFNVLNYFNGDGLGGGFPTPRGAENLFEFTRQRDKTIAAIVAMDADVVGLIEMENDAPPNSAIEDLVAGLNAATAPDTYAFINTGVIGTDQIRQAFIYKPDRVTPVGPYLVDMATIFDRPPLAQQFAYNVTGELFTVVINHFKSKGGCPSTNPTLDPNQDQGDGQGCFNARRTAQAAQLLTFINTVLIPTTGSTNVLIIGDLNSYRLEDPIAILTTAGYTDLVDDFWGAAAYSYLFDGQSGYLDYALASPTLTSRVSGVTEWHINADEPGVLDYNENFKSPGQVITLYNADAYRSSDHDPVVVGLFPYDFGDLAASYGNAWHTGNGALRLGTAWTVDPTFGPGTDDDSDDGIQRISGSWTPGGTVTIRATVTRSSGSDPAWLACWVDWNRDGSFDAAGDERIINEQVTVGPNDIPVTIPLDANVGTNGLAARCRLYDSPVEPLAPLAALPMGAGEGGEVEDYSWSFTPTAITLQEVGVKGNAAAPLLIALALILLVLGTAWGRRRLAVSH